MKIICDGLDLSDAIRKVSKALPSKAVNPVMEGIKISAKGRTLCIFASDSEFSIQKYVNADVIEEGEVLVPGKFMSDYISKLTDQQIELFNNENNQLRIKYGDCEGFVQLLNVSEYPFTEKEKSQDKIEIQQCSLKDAVEKTIFAVSIDDSRPILKGCLMEFDGLCLTTVALDGYRMAIDKKPLMKSVENKKIVVPAKSLLEISRMVNDEEDVVEIYLKDNYAIFKFVDAEVSTHLINGEYINYRQLLPDSFETNIVVNRQKFEESLDRASLPSRNDRNNLVKLEMKEGTMSIKGTSEMGNVNEKVTISLKGKDLNIAFNARYLADCLRALKTEFIKINFTSSVSPSTITPCDNDENLYLVLPVRLIG